MESGFRRISPERCVTQPHRKHELGTVGCVWSGKLSSLFHSEQQASAKCENNRNLKVFTHAAPQLVVILQPDLSAAHLLSSVKSNICLQAPTSVTTGVAGRKSSDHKKKRKLQLILMTHFCQFRGSDPNDHLALPRRRHLSLYPLPSLPRSPWIDSWQRDWSELVNLCSSQPALAALGSRCSLLMFTSSTD